MGSDFFLMLPPLFLMRSAPAIFFLCSATFLIMLPPPLCWKVLFLMLKVPFFMLQMSGVMLSVSPPNP